MVDSLGFSRRGGDLTPHRDMRRSSGYAVRARKLLCRCATAIDPVRGCGSHSI